MKLTEKQWQLIAPLFEAEPRTSMVGRPATPARDVLNGVFWILKTGARWKDLPRDYPPTQTCHRRFQQWVRSGLIQQALQLLAEDLRQRGGIDIREAFIDGTFSSAKKRGLHVGKTKRGKGTKIMAIADAHGLPVAVCIESASPHEVTLVEQTIDATFLEHAPDRLIGDKAYDSDGLDERLWRERGIEMIAPH